MNVEEFKADARARKVARRDEILTQLTERIRSEEFKDVEIPSHGIRSAQIVALVTLLVEKAPL